MGRVERRGEVGEGWSEALEDVGDDASGEKRARAARRLITSDGVSDYELRPVDYFFKLMSEENIGVLKV